MPTQKIRIYFTNWVDTYNFNAQSLNAREIALRLDPAQFESTLLYEQTPDPRVLNHANIHLVRIPPRLGTVMMLAQAFQQQDIIFRLNLTHFAYLFLHIPFFLRSRIKLVDWLEGYELDSRERSQLTARQLIYLDYIQPRIPNRVAITDAVGEAWTQVFGSAPITTIPVGVDTKQFVPPRARTHTRPVVLYVGALIERKCPHVVLLAAKCFRDADFILVGSPRGDFYKHLHVLQAKWRLENVTFKDLLPHPQLAQLMQQSDILLHPSKSEGLPKVVLEGAATGLPAIILKHYRAPAVLDGETGFQVDNVAEVMQRLDLLLHDPNARRRMGSAAVEYVQRFDWDNIVRQWQAVFVHLANQP